MTIPPTNSSLSKSRGQVILEYVLLVLCLCIIALRTTFTEGLNIQSAALPMNLGDSVYSLLIAVVLILLTVLWFLHCLCRREFSYRFSGLEIGLCLFILAAIISGFAAANKRAAITDCVTLLAPILMAVLLTQILDSHSKIKLFLICIAALAVVSAYQCSEQFFISNRMMITQYRQSPETILVPLGIKPGSLAHMLLEHRILSKDVRGFFTTGNSAGSFALLVSFAALALALEKFKNWKSGLSSLRGLVTSCIAVAVAVFGLVITHSKGAIAASLFAVAVFIAYLLFGNWLKERKKTVFIICLLAGLAGCCVIILYGLKTGRLPGGNSMLVRWQYWQASVKMYADHPFRGVGPGNFANFYPRYKPAAASEAVVDPHNFLLAILTQYGPLGLIGFLALVTVPLWRVIFSGPANSLSPQPGPNEPAFKKLALIFAVGIAAVLLIIRPMVFKMPPAADSLAVSIYVVFVLYIIPPVVFAIGCWLFAADGQTSKAVDANIVTAALFCALLGCLIHNLVDFAIFEPGVFTAFWAITACLIAMDSSRKSGPQFVFRPAQFTKTAMAAGMLLLLWACFAYCLIPVAKSTAKIQQANYAISKGWFEQAHDLLFAAAGNDSLSPAASSLNARLYLHDFASSDSKQTSLLLQAEKCLLGAIKRDNADFKNFEKLTEVYNSLAQASFTQLKTDWLNKAFDSSLCAVECYPASSQMQIELARIADQLGKVDIAVKHYKAAVEIEDSYRRQFLLMYPQKEIFSRLGEEEYQAAKQRIKYLSGKKPP